MAAPVGPAPAAARVQAPAITQNHVSEVQSLLRLTDAYSGPITGNAGGATNTAISQYISSRQGKEGNTLTPNSTLEDVHADLTRRLQSDPEFQARVRTAALAATSTTNPRAAASHEVRAAQVTMNMLGHKDERGQALRVDGIVGGHTAASRVKYNAAPAPTAGRADPSTQTVQQRYDALIGQIDTADTGRDAAGVESRIAGLAQRYREASAAGNIDRTNLLDGLSNDEKQALALHIHMHSGPNGAIDPAHQSQTLAAAEGDINTIRTALDAGARASAPTPAAAGAPPLQAAWKDVAFEDRVRPGASYRVGSQVQRADRDQETHVYRGGAHQTQGVVDSHVRPEDTAWSRTLGYNDQTLVVPENNVGKGAAGVLDVGRNGELYVTRIDPTFGLMRSQVNSLLGSDADIQRLNVNTVPFHPSSEMTRNFDNIDRALKTIGGGEHGNYDARAGFVVELDGGLLGRVHRGEQGFEMDIARADSRDPVVLRAMAQTPNAVRTQYEDFDDSEQEVRQRAGREGYYMPAREPETPTPQSPPRPS